MTVTSTRGLLVLLALPFVIASSPVAASETIRNISATPHGASVGRSLAEIAAAIKHAAKDYRWNIVEESPGLMTASILVRRHEAVVTIGYDELNYWIEYKDSVNLDYHPDTKTVGAGRNRRTIQGPRIHGAYNRWVANLSARIKIWARKPPSALVSDIVSPDQPMLVADEIEKLDALRQRGILTQEEFDQQKAKLLGR